MPVTPSGILTEPMTRLRDALAALTSFQTWTGAADATEALAFIGLLERTDMARPFAVIDDGTKYEIESLDAGANFGFSGDVFLLFEDDVAAENAASEPDASMALTNAVGGILEELVTYCGNHRDVFSIEKVSKAFGPARAGDKERATDDYMQIGFMVTWKS